MPQDPAQFTAFQRFFDQLVESGVDEKSAAFILGKLVNRVTTEAIAQASQEIGEDKVASLGEPTQDGIEDWQVKFEELYLKETGKEFTDLFAQIAEKEVVDFENQ